MSFFSTGGTKAFTYRITKHLFNYKSFIFTEFVLWPLLLVVSFGLLVSTLTNDITHVTYVLAAAISWRVMAVFQQSITLGFMEDFWHDTMRQTWVMPFRVADIIFGNASFGLVSSIATLMVTFAASHYIFGTVYFPIEVFLACLVIMVLWGGILGVFVLGALLRYGESAARLMWIVTDVVVLTSGVFYPIAMLPAPLQAFAHFLPSTYLFAILKERVLVPELFGAAIVLTIAYLILARHAVKSSLKKAKEVGRLVKFD